MDEEKIFRVAELRTLLRSKKRGLILVQLKPAKGLPLTLEEQRFIRSLWNRISFPLSVWLKTFQIICICCLFQWCKILVEFNLLLDNVLHTSRILSNPTEYTRKCSVEFNIQTNWCSYTKIKIRADRGEKFTRIFQCFEIF